MEQLHNASTALLYTKTAAGAEKVMLNPLLVRTASLLLRHCMHLARNELLVVLADRSPHGDLVDAFTAAGEGLGVEVMLVCYTPVDPVPMRTFGNFARASLEPEVRRLPRPAVAALESADAVIILNSDLQLLFDHSFLEIARERTRIGWLPYVGVEELVRLMPASEREADRLQATTDRVGQRFERGSTVTVTSPGGTDLRLQIGEHRINWSGGIQNQQRGYGGLEIWPAGQVSTVPDTGSAAGTLVIDRSINAPEYKEIRNPIVLDVSNGRVVSIEGDSEARTLMRYLQDLDDPRALHLTEFGVGTNPRCVAAGRAGPSEDTHTAGCVSFALGADVHLGGTNVAPCHVDMTIDTPTARVDDDIVVQDGRLLPE